MSSPTVQRIAVVEDDPLVGDYLRDILAQAPGFVLTGIARTLAAAEHLVQQGADLFLVDIGMPEGSGLTLIPRIRSTGSAKALILTSFGDRETVIAALQAGADGYLLKDCDPQTLLQGIQVTLDGGAPISPAAAVFLLERLRPKTRESTSQEEQLTEREIELLRCFSRGATYKDAARSLGISPLTVGTHVKAIYRKLEVHSRGEAVFRAVRDRKIDLSSI